MAQQTHHCPKLLVLRAEDMLLTEEGRLLTMGCHQRAFFWQLWAARVCYLEALGQHSPAQSVSRVQWLLCTTFDVQQPAAGLHAGLTSCKHNTQTKWR